MTRSASSLIPWSLPSIHIPPYSPQVSYHTGRCVDVVYVKRGKRPIVRRTGSGVAHNLGQPYFILSRGALSLSPAELKPRLLQVLHTFPTPSRLSKS